MHLSKLQFQKLCCISENNEDIWWGKLMIIFDVEENRAPLNPVENWRMKMQILQNINISNIQWGIDGSSYLSGKLFDFNDKTIWFEVQFEGANTNA